MPVSKVFVIPLIKVVNVLVSPCQFIRKEKIIFEKSARLFPTFFISPERIVLPDPSFSSVISPVNTKWADNDVIRFWIKFTPDGSGMPKSLEPSSSDVSPLNLLYALIWFTTLTIVLRLMMSCPIKVSTFITS